MALLVLLLVVIFILSYYNLYKHLKSKVPPGPRPWPIVDNLYGIKPVLFRCFAGGSQVYSPIMSVWIGSTLNVIVSNSELTKEVLKEKVQQLPDRYRSTVAAKASKNGQETQDLIMADYGPHYVKVRKVCTLELFSSKRLEAAKPLDPPRGIKPEGIKMSESLRLGTHMQIPLQAIPTPRLPIHL